MKSSSRFDFCQKPVAVTVFAQFVVIHAAFFFENLLFDRAQQIVRGVVEQFGLGLGLSLCHRFHAHNMHTKS